MMNKKAISGVIVAGLLLIVSVVSFGMVNNWYVSLLDEYESKQLQSLGTEDTIEIVGMKNESLGMFVYVKNLNAGYTVVDWVKVGSENCTIDGSNVLAPRDTTKIKVLCSSYSNVNDLAILTDFYIAQGRKEIE